MSEIIVGCRSEDAVNVGSSDSVCGREERRKTYDNAAVISVVSVHEGTDSGDIHRDEYCRPSVGIVEARIREQHGVPRGTGGRRYVSQGGGNCRHVHVIRADEHGGEFHRRLAGAFSLPFHGLSDE